MRPRLLRPPDFLSGLTSDFSGLVLVSSLKSAVVMVLREGVYGRYFLVAIWSHSLPYDRPSSCSMRCPGLRVTTALRRPAVRPAKRPWRLALPASLTRLILVTSTSKTVSMASLIWTRLARG